MRRSDARRTAARAAVTGLVTVSVTAVLVTAGTSAASASCAGPRPSPEQIVTGTARGIGDAPYLPAGEYALIGRVTTVDRLPTPTPSPTTTGTKRVDDFGPADEVQVTALAYFIGPDRGRDLRFTVRGSSLFGYPFKPGTTYFIPVRNDGSRAGLSICDSITPLPGTGPALEQEITRLITAATAKGVPAVRVPAKETRTAAAALVAAPSQDTVSLRPASLIVASTLAAAGAVAAALFLRRRRRGDPAARPGPA